MSKEKPKGGGGLFKDVNNLRKNEDLDQDAQDLKDKLKFKEFTFFGKIARNTQFEYITLAVICLNALYLGYDCDYTARWGKPEDLYDSTLWGFILMDHFFCLFFTVELLIRFFAYKSKLYTCRDAAFLFDFVLVFFMVVETWVLAFVGQIEFLKQLSILRLLRLCRLLRMGKIMRYFPELQLIVKGMVAAVRSVGCATILLMLVLYVFSIIFTSTYHQGLKDDDDPDIHDSEVLFGSIGKSMRHLFIMATILDDITACTNTIRSTENMYMLMAFMVCVLISSFTLFNMLLGILCEVVEATQNGEQDKQESKKLQNSMKRFFRDMDEDGNGMVSRNEFVKMATNPKIVDQLADLHIKAVDFEKYAELIFAPRAYGEAPAELDHDAVVELIMRLRPGQYVNCLDFCHFRTSMKNQYKSVRTYISDIEEILVEAANCADEAENAPTQGQRMSMQIQDGLESEKAVEIVAKKTTGKRKPKETMKTLSRGPAVKAAKAPPYSNRWDGSSPVDNALLGRSPRTPGGDDVVMDRLHLLAEKRRILSEQVRTNQMSNTGQAFFNGPHGASVPHMGTTAQSWSHGQRFADFDDEDDNQMPFTPMVAWA